MASSYNRLIPLISGWPTILLFAGIGLLLGVVLSFTQQLEYSSTTRLLITQQLGAVDAYTAGRSAERIAEDLGNAVQTSTFYQAFLGASDGFDTNFFSSDELKRRKQWQKAVTTSVSRSSGLLTIRAFHPDANQANILAATVADVLSETGWVYSSGGNIAIQLVDTAVNSRYPVRPNVFVNGFSGFMLGILAGIGYILLQVEQLRRRHQLMHEG
ncbi:MAG: hypothetical protein O3B64_03425 [bacterium]|nr:hypothetical protein [bacterium]